MGSIGTCAAENDARFHGLETRLDGLSLAHQRNSSKAHDPSGSWPQARLQHWHRVRQKAAAAHKNSRILAWRTELNGRHDTRPPAIRPTELVARPRRCTAGDRLDSTRMLCLSAGLRDGLQPF